MSLPTRHSEFTKRGRLDLLIAKAAKRIPVEPEPYVMPTMAVAIRQAEIQHMEYSARAVREARRQGL